MVIIGAAGAMRYIVARPYGPSFGAWAESRGGISSTSVT